jgi:hypothetical protein
VRCVPEENRSRTVGHQPVHRPSTGGAPLLAAFARGGPTNPSRSGSRGSMIFNVWAERKRVENLDYIHNNPVKRGLVAEPEQWRWSSYRSYAFGEPGLVRVNDSDIMKMTVRTSVA